VRILFVCTANIVRSYMAEGILKGKLDRMQKGDILASSAGLLDMCGASADPIAVKIMEEEGFPLSGHRSRLLDRSLVEAADWIIPMEAAHRSLILNDYPDVGEKLRLLKTFSRDFDGTNCDIKDPYRRSIFLYRLCFSEIYLATDGLLQCI